MRRIYALLVLAFVAFAPKAFAGDEWYGEEGYGRTYASYGDAVVTWSKASDVNKELFPLSKSVILGHLGTGRLLGVLPIYIEYGANVQYTYGDNANTLLGVTTNYKADMLAVNIPIHLSLNLSLGGVGIVPYAGVNLRGNILGTQTTELKVGNTTTTEELRLFDDSDDKGAAGDNAWERFQAGLSYGVSLNLGRCTVGVGIVSDLMPLVEYDDDNNATLTYKTLSIGFAF